ncbi:MAG: mechanosensitive ion channel family protein [Minisyncoccia bacterium]|jgi:small conductance mechanosensitive channel
MEKNTVFISNFYIEKSVNLLEKILLFFKLNLDNFLTLILYLVILFILYFVSKKIISRIIKLSLNLKNVPVSHDRILTLSSVFNSILKIIFSFVFLVLILKEFNINIVHVLTGAGVIGAAIVYIFQGLIQDIIKGWILIFEDQMRKGEWVNINNTFIGKVIEFNLRHVVLRDFDRNLIFIPNSQINTVFNLSRELKRNFIKIKIKRPENIDEFLQNFENFLLSLETDKIQKLKIHSINIGENFLELTIMFRCKFVLRDEIFNKLKLELYRNFKDLLIEIT